MYLDMLRNPINVGDLVAYPQQRGSSSAYTQVSRVVNIDPMVKEPDGTVHYEGKKYKPGDYSSVRWPVKAVYNDATRNWISFEQNEYAYRIRVERLEFDDQAQKWVPNSRDERLSWILNVDRVIVVTSLIP